MLRHAKYSTATAAVSSTVATKVPSTLCAAPCATRARAISGRKDATREVGGTHLADDLAQQEKVELGEDEEDGGEDEVPHRADLVEHGEHDVGHDRKVEDHSAAQRACERGGVRGAMSTHAPGQMLVRTKSGMLWRSAGGFDGPKTEVKEKPTSRAM